MCSNNKKEEPFKICPKCSGRMEKKEEVHDELGTHFYDVKYWECTNPNCGFCMTR